MAVRVSSTTYDLGGEIPDPRIPSETGEVVVDYHPDGTVKGVFYRPTVIGDMESLGEHVEKSLAMNPEDQDLEERREIAALLEKLADG
jgi:hypothetical protein